MKYKRYGDVVICAIPENDELNMVEIENIVEHTHNTWQHDRPISEIRENTIQGKRAEIVIEQILAENSDVRYLSYDKLRRDNFNKHAPFDGVIFNNSINDSILKDAIEQINNDVFYSRGDSGTVSMETREFLENKGIFTVEIKSSLLQDPRDYRKMVHKRKEQRTEEDYNTLCEYIKSFYDYFVYPYYCRDSSEITSFYEYTAYVRKINPEIANGVDKAEFLQNLMKVEFNNACNIYTRVFFDVLSDEIIIPGYITKTRFFEEPRIMKMPSPKSKNAIYYMYHMNYGSGILEVDNDVELKQWNRLSKYANLLGMQLPMCPTCGKCLKLVETTSNPDCRKHKFLYLCENCKTNKWFEMNQIHRQNMNAR